jgi:hypothetical protein
MNQFNMDRFSEIACERRLGIHQLDVCVILFGFALYENICDTSQKTSKLVLRSEFEPMLAGHL